MSILKILLNKLLLISLLSLVSNHLYSQLSTVLQGGRVVSEKLQNTIAKEPVVDSALLPLAEKEMTTTKEAKKGCNSYSIKVSPPLRNLKLTSLYGTRFHPILKEHIFHSGIDLKASYEGVYAFVAGVVEKVAFDRRSGLHIVLSHGGDLKTVYAHLSYIGVIKGQQVNSGSLIAISGNTGFSTAPHLHFALKYKNAPVDPSVIFQLFKIPSYSIFFTKE